MLYEEYWESRGKNPYVLKSDPEMILQANRFLYYMAHQLERVRAATFEKTYKSGLKRGFDNRNICWTSEFLGDVNAALKGATRFQG